MLPVCIRCREANPEALSAVPAASKLHAASASVIYAGWGALKDWMGAMQSEAREDGAMAFLALNSAGVLRHAFEWQTL